jgi:ornithine decarboxylase
MAVLAVNALAFELDSTDEMEVCCKVLQHHDSLENFEVLDITKIKPLMTAWRLHLPTVRPFYAVKTNSDPKVLAEFAALGAGFDCASKVEVDKALLTQVSPQSDIIFAQSTKRKIDFQSIEATGIQLTTFECVEELIKIAKTGLQLKLLFRIKPIDTSTGVNFGVRFGASRDEYQENLECARSLGLDVIGVAFHVGNITTDMTAFYNTIAAASDAFKIGASLGFSMTLLDIGGGFTGPRFESAAAQVRRGLDEFFNDPSFQFMAEPGRFFSATLSSLCVSVVGKRERTTEGIRRLEYVLSDGVMGSFRATILQNDALVFRPTKPSTASAHPSVFWGPTCSALDKIYEGECPELEVDDTLLFSNMGAYSNELSTDFNGIEMVTHHKYYVLHDPKPT